MWMQPNFHFIVVTMNGHAGSLFSEWAYHDTKNKCRKISSHAIQGRFITQIKTIHSIVNQSQPLFREAVGKEAHLR